MQEITSTEKSALRSKAHKLKPVVLVGNKGVTETVLAEIDRALNDHELIKIRLPNVGKEKKLAAAADICDKLNACLIQCVGNIVTLYRKRES